MDCYLDKAPQKCCLQDLVVQNVVEKQFLRWEGPTALKFEYLILGPNWDPHTETWPGRTPRAGILWPDWDPRTETWPGHTPRAGILWPNWEPCTETWPSQTSQCRKVGTGLS